jgi:gliding motility-associated-like protein
MNKIRFILILFFSFLFLSINHAQTIKRWTFSSLGKLGTIVNNKDSLMFEYTFGQCPGCNVLIGGSTFLRQGFQQPLVDVKKAVDTTNTGGGGGSTGLPPCTANDPAGNFNLDFAITPMTTTCGTYFDFEYTSDVKPSMKFAWDFSSTGVPRYSTAQNPEKIGFTNKGAKFIRLEAGVTCSKSITKVLDVTVDAFVAQATQGGDINCKGQKTSSISLAVFGGTAPYSYQWSNNLANTPNQSNIGGGNYSYTVTDSKNCSFSSTISIVEPKDSLSVKVTVKDETCRDTKDGQLVLTVKGGTPGYDFLWSDGATSKDRLNLGIGTLFVTITDDNGCTVNARGEVKRFCDKTGKDFPNTFTPNDDGINDGWEFPGIDDFPNNKVEVFNRWGQLIFDKTGYKSGEWKGTNSDGQPLPAGPYFYVVNLNDRDKTVFSGAVTIIR